MPINEIFDLATENEAPELKHHDNDYNVGAEPESIKAPEKGGLNIQQPQYNNIVEYTPGYIPGYTPNIPGYSPGYTLGHASGFTSGFSPSYTTGYTQVTNAAQSSGYNPFDG